MRVYLHGPPRSGKTARLAAQLVDWLDRGVRPDRILALSASRPQAGRFRESLGRAAATGTFGQPRIGTFYGLAQQHVDLFFPLVAQAAGFADPRREPAFIDIEAAQYFLNRIVDPRITDFDELRLTRPRLLGQLLDNAHKAALAGFGLDEIAARLSAAWTGDPRRLKAYERAQEIALEFRRFCLDHGALDFSLQHDVFARHLLMEPAYQKFIADQYRFLLFDNVEELPPIAHDFIRIALAGCEEAIVVEDDPGGYRLFLGADPGSARGLRTVCDTVEVAAASPENRPMAAFGRALASVVAAPAEAPSGVSAGGSRWPRVTLLATTSKFWVSMVQAAADQIIALTRQGVPAGEIAVLAPYVEDVLRFELEERLRDAGLRVRAVRPSRPLYDHPVARGLVTLARLGHPELAAAETRATGVSTHEIARALAVAIAGLDPARAKVLADGAQRMEPGRLPLIADKGVWDRAGMRFRERYEALSRWLSSWRAAESRDSAPPLDVWWQTLFAEMLSQPGFGLAADGDGANVADKLARSARVFREALAATGIAPAQSIAADYVGLLSEGVMAAQYAPERESDGGGDGVLLAPVYTYLTGDYRSQAQIWLDVNASGWYDRIHQALTHPYVLSRAWQAMRARFEAEGQAESAMRWSEEDEHLARQDMLRRVIVGLCDRCGERLYLASSQLGLSGQEEAGALARALQRAL
ncbi:MAG: hypothetical protein ABIQ99_17270 [Thermoflexales bacterium]